MKQGPIKVTKGQGAVFLVGFVMLVSMVIATEMVESAPITFDNESWKVEGRATSDLGGLVPPDPDYVLDGPIPGPFPLTPIPYNKLELATGFGPNGAFRVQNATLTGSEAGIRRISVEAATDTEIVGSINPSVNLQAEFNGVWTAPSNGFIDFKVYHEVPGYTQINRPDLPQQGEENPSNAFALVNVIERTEGGVLNTHYTSGLFTYFTHSQSHPHTNSFKANIGSEYYFQLMVSVDSEDWNWSALHMEVDFRDVAVYLLADSTPYTPLQIPPTASLISEPGTPWLDADNDGVPDSRDNCPDDANSDQDDLDEDNIGDVCDGDIDGDGYDNDVDNCHLVSNVGQEDTDFDGDGDACDDDDDNDGFLDVNDNCSLIFNDQTDTDGDGKGDACDGDLDGDGVGNTNDNCPNIANSSQNDWDSDFEGDACDTDVDGDGVLNDSDQCSFTPLLGTVADTVVDPANGCSINQLSPCEGTRGRTTSWKNHGKYVSGVAKSANSFLKQGLITEEEKDSIMSHAANSDCGQK